MRYKFKCTKCNHEQDLFFLAADYDDEVHNEEELDGLHRTESCEKCGTKSLYRHITLDSLPAVMGGTTGYKSMERYWRDNPGLARKKEDQLQDKIEDRHRRRVLDNINKQMKGTGRDKRHKDYGEGQGETKLKPDD
jgi:hypothetical protein